jgi:hypothetical protein
MNNSLACTQAWLQGFRMAADVLQTPRPSSDALNRSKAYLEEALVILMQHQDTWNQPPATLFPPEFPYDPSDYVEEVRVGAPMVSRRLLIRLVTLQSELLAREATQCRFQDPPQWLAGVEYYEQSLERLNFAMHLADSEYARLVQENENAQSVMSEDASIVQVANGSLIQQRDKYRRAAETAARKIRAVLEPQWQSRDEIKQRMGDRWFNNPAPKKDHWKMREADEMALKELEATIERLDALEIQEYRMNERRELQSSESNHNAEPKRRREAAGRRIRMDNCSSCQQRFGHYH